MAQYTERLWTQTKDTEQLTFIAGVDLPYRELVKESGPNTNIMVVATTVDAIGYVLSPKGVLAGEKVDVQMLYGRPGGGGGSGVQSVTGLDTDNTDPLNPIVNIAVDGITITGQGTPGDPLVAVTGGGGTVTSVTGVGPNVFITGTLTDPIVNAGTQAWEWSGFITTPQLSNYQNNYTQAGFANISTLKVIGDPFDPAIMTGFAGGTEGRFLIVHNASLDTPIYFTNQDPLSAAANQILMSGLPGEFYDLPIGGTVLLRYDADVQKWRLLGNYVYTVIDDGGGVITVTGGAANKTVGFNGVFTDGVTITGNGTAGSPLTAPATPGSSNFELTYFVDGLYGNDGTAVPDSSVLKYQTIDAAIAAAGPLDYTIHVSPGSYSISAGTIIGGWKKFYLEPGCFVACASNCFSINPGSRLEIKGYGDLNCSGFLFASNNPTSNAIADVDIECDYISSNAGTQLFCDATSLKVKIRTNQIFDMGIDAVGWFDVEISTDRWNSQNSRMIWIGDDTLYDCQTKFDLLGPRKYVCKGRTRQNTDYVRAATTAIGIGVNIFPTVSKTRFTVVDLYADFDTVDGIFLNLAGGITRHYGNVIHRKSDTLGNELPWLYCDQDVAVIENGPYFEHMYGDWVSGTHPTYAGSLNNELGSIRCGGTFVFNGRYKNSGENTGVGAWPLFQFQNNNISPAYTVIIFNGEMANTDKDVSLFQLQDTGVNPTHTYKIICKTVTCENGDADTFSCLLPNTPIFVYHSLTMNHNYSSNFIDGLSVNRTIIDRNVTVHIPEYAT